MSPGIPFYFVDVFASRPLTGAPLSHVTDGDRLGESQMRAISLEFNQSETTFLLRPSLPRATWRLRSFTRTPWAPWIWPEGTVAVVEQGHALGRPSRIGVMVSGSRVRVSGSGLVVAEGTLTV